MISTHSTIRLMVTLLFPQQSKWVQGHAERRKADTEEWTNDERANDIADCYADRAWRTQP